MTVVKFVITIQVILIILTIRIVVIWIIVSSPLALRQKPLVGANTIHGEQPNVRAPAQSRVLKTGAFSLESARKTPNAGFSYEVYRPLSLSTSPGQSG